MALIGQHGGKLLAVYNTNTYASNGGHNGSNGGNMEFDVYLPTDHDDTRIGSGANTADVEYGMDVRDSAHYIGISNWGTYYWGNTWKEFLIQRWYGASEYKMVVTEIRDATYRGHPSWNGGGSGDGVLPDVSVASVANSSIRIKVGGDYWNSNNGEVYYLGGSGESAWIGRSTTAHPIYDTTMSGAWSD
tara:strand:- start:385 stop:951 length:567 start_codon:yes stop_codon:yes gene_type:complete